MAVDLAKIHPELRAAAKAMPSMDIGILSLLMIRIAMIFMRAAPVVEDVAVHDQRIAIPGRLGTLRLRVYRPNAIRGQTPALLWIHGGGYVLGKPEMDDRICCEYARAVGMTVVSVDYRLAPPHRFPAALDDCYSALTWMQANARELGVDPERIAIGGASAGAGLAAALAQLACDRRDIRPMMQLLIYPMLDNRTSRDRSRGPARVAWSEASNRFSWHAYLGSAHADPDVAYAVPARRADMSGLAPVWIGVGTEDLFYEENLTYAARLEAAGTPCQLVVVPGAFHGFDVVAPTVPLVQAFRQSQITALKRYLLQST